MIKTRLLVFVKYMAFWLVFFVFFRALFLIYNYPHSIQLPIGQVVKSFLYGFRLDIAMAGYMSLGAALIFMVTFMSSASVIKKVLNALTIFSLVLFSLMSFVDMELYRNWGYRMDGTIFFYLESPKEAMASTEWWLILYLVLAFTITNYFSYKLYIRYVVSGLDNMPQKKAWPSIPIFLFIAGLLVIPIRGGVGKATNNVGSVYFSTTPFANHAAINMPWQFFLSLGDSDMEEGYHFMSDDEAAYRFHDLMSGVTDSTRFTTVDRPNVIILILESFSSRVVGPLGGIPDATPNFSRLINEGVLFKHCFANGDRSDKGIVAVLSGYPAQPRTSIIKYGAKVEKLPHLGVSLKKFGYHNVFYYGGDVNFASMRSHIVRGKQDRIVSETSFGLDVMRSKWGVCDHEVFSKIIQDCNQDPQPFFKTFFTLNSHEPFDVPHTSLFNEDTEESDFLNSIHYTDSCLGAFIDQAKQQPWWDSTLVVLVPDHTSRHPGNVSYNVRTKFEIPLLLLGGALKRGGVEVETYVNQCDIPRMIGRELNEDFNEFTFSKPAFDAKHSFSFFTFNDGFGFYNDSTGFVYDNKGQHFTTEEPLLNDSTVAAGKAYLQYLMNDFNALRFK